jgi:hypothetical protein
MASNGKKKTTMAKLNRETKLRERRLDKQAKKDARKRAAADGPAHIAALVGDAPDGDENLSAGGADEESRERGSNP